MIISIIGSESDDSMESNLKEALEHAGHQVRIFDIKNSFLFKVGGRYANLLDFLARRYSETYDSKIFLRLAKEVVAYEPDLVIGVYRFIHPLFVKYIKKANIKIIHINPDALTTLEYQQIFVEAYDAYFVKDPYMWKFMNNNMKLNVHLYNEAFNLRSHIRPAIAKDVCEQEVNIDVMTYGTMYPYRCKMLKSVLDAGIDLKVYGVKPNRFYDNSLDKAYQNKYITGEEKARILYGSKIVFNQMHYAEIEGVNCRFFEVNGSGAFQLSDYRPILHDLLPVDPELVSFKNTDEGIDKIRYYLNHPQERYEIAEKVYNHFYAHYSYDQLVKFILDKI